MNENIKNMNENIKKTYWAQAQYGGIVTIIYSNEDKENYTLNSSNGKQIIGIHDMINNIGVGKPFMNLFPMSMISKPIIVRGYNSNKPFIPLEHYIGNCQEDYMYGQDFEYIETKNRTHTILRVSNNDKIYIDISPMSMPNHFVDRLKYWHFNVDNIPDDEFINAHESKVYDIIVETNSEQFEYIKNEKYEHRCIIKEGFAQYPNEDIGALYCSECKDICKETKNKINN